MVSVQDCRETRRNAYCLVFGIRPKDVQEQFQISYQFLLNLSKKRQEKHDQDPENCPCKDEKACRSCGGIKQIKIDVHRTALDYKEEGLDELNKIPLEAGKNPIYNILVALLEFD